MSRSAKIVEILSEAFAGDPFMRWVFAGSESVPADLVVWWQFLVEALPDGGELWLGDDKSSAALWHPPRFEVAGEAQAPDGQDEVNPFVELMTGLVGDRLPLVLEMFKRLVDAHPVEAHWYLPAVGTTPRMQGRGSGAALLRPALDRCDREGLPAYLESSNPRNVPFYFRLGFVVVDEITTPDDAASVTTMWRLPVVG